MTTTSLGHKLRVLRAERGLTLREAAALTGVAKETISDIERGHRRPRDITLGRIAAAYDANVGDLLEEQPETLPLTLAAMSRATPAERRRALGAATDAQVWEYVGTIARAIDQAARWGREEQDQEALAAYKAFLLALRAETDPFDLLPPSRERRAALIGDASVPVEGEGVTLARGVASR